MNNTELKEGQVYHGWKISYIGSFGRKCDICKITRKNIIEFVHPDTPIGDKWDGFRWDDEPMVLGTECVKKFISGKVKMPAPITRNTLYEQKEI